MSAVIIPFPAANARAVLRDSLGKREARPVPDYAQMVREARAEEDAMWADKESQRRTQQLVDLLKRTETYRLRQAFYEAHPEFQ